jgi:hypothetical protein
MESDMSDMSDMSDVSESEPITVHSLACYFQNFNPRPAGPDFEIEEGCAGWISYSFLISLN